MKILKFNLLIQLFLIFLICCCSYNKEAKNNISTNKSNIISDKNLEINCDSSSILSIMKRVNFIEANLNNYSKIDDYLLFDNLIDTQKMTLYYSGKTPIYLKFTVFDDDGTSSGEGAYYFNENGCLLCKNISLELNIYEAYLDSNKIFGWSIEKGDEIKISKRDKWSSQYREAIALLGIDTYMQKFSKIQYKIPNKSSFFIPSMKTKAKIALHTSPDIDSPIIKKLVTDTELSYITCNKQIDTIGYQSWIWYKVKLEDNIEGWIFGYPSNIEFYFF